MNTQIPQIDSALSGVQLRSLNGFRALEDWGRWSLGKVSQVNIRAKKTVWVEARIKIGLPVSGQTALIILNGENLARVENSQQPATYDLRLALHLRAGNNTIQLTTNKSNLDSSSRPFAINDKSDIALSVLSFNLIKPQPFTDDSSGKLYNIANLGTSSAYLGAGGQKIQFFTRLSNSQLLKYRLLSAYDRQTFEIRIDGDLLLRTSTQQRGTLLSGQLPIQFKDQLQIVTITAFHDTVYANHPQDSVEVLEKYNGKFPFYIQELRLISPQPWQIWQQSASIVGFFACIFLLILWLFRLR